MVFDSVVGSFLFLPPRFLFLDGLEGLPFDCLLLFLLFRLEEEGLDDLGGEGGVDRLRLFLLL